MAGNGAGVAQGSSFRRVPCASIDLGFSVGLAGKSEERMVGGVTGCRSGPIEYVQVSKL